MIAIPKEKIDKAYELIEYMLSKRKTTLHNMQKLTGFLNFLGKAIIPGRAFTRRLYSQTSGVLKKHHHIAITTEIKMDLQMWQEFLKHPSVYCRKFMGINDNINY